jgi:hypothetical protein
VDASFSAREHHVRQLGNRLESGVAKGETLPKEPFEQILQLPRSEARYLKDTICSLLEGRLGGGDAERVRRLQDAGSATTRYVGLSFTPEVINQEFVPRLIASADSALLESPETLGSRISRYERISALAQLAPHIREDSLDEVMSAALSLAGHDGEFHPDLLLPLANFERAYRSHYRDGGETPLDRCRDLCLESVRAVLATAVEALAEVDQDSISDAMDILPLVHTSGVSLLTLLPSVSRADDVDCKGKLEDILDSTEWLLSRNEHFPGNYVQRQEVEMFDRVRGILSISAAMLSLRSEGHGDTVQRMRIAKREGQHRLGTAILTIARATERDDAIEYIRELVREQLRIDASVDARLISKDAILEIGAVAWHLDVGNVPEVRNVFDRIRDPRGQFYLTKALQGTPWV